MMSPVSHRATKATCDWQKAELTGDLDGLTRKCIRQLKLCLPFGGTPRASKDEIAAVIYDCVCVPVSEFALASLAERHGEW